MQSGTRTPLRCPLCDGELSNTRVKKIGDVTAHLRWEIHAGECTAGSRRKSSASHPGKFSRFTGWVERPGAFRSKNAMSSLSQQSGIRWMPERKSIRWILISGRLTGTGSDCVHLLQVPRSSPSGGRRLGVASRRAQR
jgi:hypothetical protein